IAARGRGENDGVADCTILRIDQVAIARGPALAEFGDGVARDLRHGVAHEHGRPIAVERAAIDRPGNAARERAELSLARAHAVERGGERRLRLLALGDVEYAAVDVEEAAVAAIHRPPAVLDPADLAVAAGDTILKLERRALRHGGRRRALDRSP